MRTKSPSALKIDVIAVSVSHRETDFYVGP